MDYDEIAEVIQEELIKLGIVVAQIHFDRFMAPFFKAACERVRAFEDAEWMDVPQTFRPMGHRLTSLNSLMLEGKVRHGGHPLLNMAASNAIAVTGRKGLRTLDKSASTQRIDPLVAMTLAAWPFGDGRQEEFDPAVMIA